MSSRMQRTKLRAALHLLERGANKIATWRKAEYGIARAVLQLKKLHKVGVLEDEHDTKVPESAVNITAEDRGAEVVSMRRDGAKPT